MKSLLLVSAIFLAGCHNHPNRTHPILVDQDDLNEDGVVNEDDLDEPDASDPFCYSRIFERLCVEHECGKKCKHDKPRWHEECEDDDGDDD